MDLDRRGPVAHELLDLGGVCALEFTAVRAQVVGIDALILEFIYADTSGDSPQAGILIYTAAADSDGTLGGLVDLGKPENLGRLLEQALNRSKICSSDPLCSEHDPEKDRSLHGAACHACSLVAETSCERGNRYLDRSLLVPTLERADAAFFKGF